MYLKDTLSKNLFHSRIYLYNGRKIELLKMSIKTSDAYHPKPLKYNYWNFAL